MSIIYVVSIFDKGENQMRNVWYYDNEPAVHQRIEYEAQKYDGLVRKYDGSYEENPDEYDNGLVIDWHMTKLESVFDEELARKNDEKAAHWEAVEQEIIYNRMNGCC